MIEMGNCKFIEDSNVNIGRKRNSGSGNEKVKSLEMKLIEKWINCCISIYIFISILLYKQDDIFHFASSEGKI